MSAPLRDKATPLPLRNCYWVLPGRLLAGEYPGGANREATQERLKRFLVAGVDAFLDLTQSGELDVYAIDLPAGVEHVRKPIRDHSIPASSQQMAEILDYLHEALRSGRCVYVHCRAGIGRTGTAIGCLLVERGLSGDEALLELNRLWLQAERSQQWPTVPETDEQRDYVRSWSARTSAAAASAAAESDPLMDPATLAAARGLRDRFLGTVLGLAVADAVAAATQYRRPGTFTPIGDMLGGGPFDLPRGAWSDDTAMALCLADSLLASDGFDARDQVDRYRQWQQSGYLSATGQCVGITASTTRAIAMAQWRRQAFSGSHDPRQLDPEPLSRVAPAVLFYFASAAEAVEQASQAARATCQAPVVLEACRQLARALHAALSGQSKAAILAAAGLAAPARSEPESQPRDTATAPQTLAAALRAFEATDNYRDAVLQAANCGGHSDVIGAVCGALAGAHYGLKAIPPSWHNGLMQKDLIASYADRLLAHALLGLSG